MFCRISYIFLQSEHYLSGLQEIFLATNKRTQQPNEHQHEIIKEQQESLHIFKKKTTDSMESTCLLLNRHHTKQPQINLDEAKSIKNILEAEQLKIEKHFEAIRKDIFQILTESKQRNQAQQLNRSQDIPVLVPGGAAALETVPQPTPSGPRVSYHVH